MSPQDPTPVPPKPARVGVIMASPLLALGLISILEDKLPVQGITLEFDDIDTQDLAAIILDGRCVLDDLLTMVARLRKKLPHLKVVVVGWALSAEDVQRVIGAGAKGYLLDSSAEAEIGMALEVVLDGSIWAPRKVLARLIEEGATLAVSGAGPEQPPEELSAREIEVMNLLKNGRSNREIAAALGIEPATVKAHLGRMLRKTHTKNRLEMTLRSVEHQLSKLSS